MIRKLVFAAAMQLVSLPALAQEVSLEIEPDYVETADEVIFSARDSLLDGVDTYHFDFRNRRYSIVSADGHFEQGPIPENAAAWVPCIGSGPALMGCIFAGVVAALVCDAMQHNTLRRLNAQCVRKTGFLRAVWEPSNSGICGQVMNGACRVGDRRIYLTEE